jgi:hypothetical protein
MVAQARRVKETRYETDIPIEDYAGISTFGPHSTLPLEVLRACVNYDILPGYLKSRRGSTNLQGLGQKFATKDVLNGRTWAIGAAEYEIQQVQNGSTTEFWWAQILPTTTAHAQIMTLAGAALTTSTAAIADMKVSGNKLFLFHATGNSIVEWNGTAFVARSAGLPRISLTSLAGSGSSSLSGRYTVGAELVYQPDGADLVAGSPNRKTSGGRRLEVTVSGQNILVQLDAATFPGVGTAYDYWTHVRVWRSLNQNLDLTDLLNVPDVQGLPDELFAEQLIDRATLIGAGYQVTLSKLDSELPADGTSEYPALSLNGIELLPIPASATGAYHRDRIWVADPLNGSIAYSNSAGDAYAEQYNPLNVLRAERGDGQLVIALIPLEADLILLKEARTLRVPNGDPDAGIEGLDAAIGISHIKLATFVPKVGICAITNDQSDFRILGYDLIWTSAFAGQDVSRAIRTQTALMAASPTFVSMAYANGKLTLSDGTGTLYVLNAKEQKGWGTYQYPMNGAAQAVMTFAKGSRMLVASRSTYLVEIEVDGLNTDIDTASDVAAEIALSHTLSRFQSGEGRHVLEMENLSIVAQLSSNLRAFPFANGYPWPNKVTEKEATFVPDVGAYAAGDAGLEREYKLYLEDRLVAQYHHFRIETSAPATIHTTNWRGIIDETGMGEGTFDPFATLSEATTTPEWLRTAILDAGAGERDLAAADIVDAADGARDPSTMGTYDRG